MNIKRITFWAGFIVILGLIVWGMAVAMNRDISAPRVGTPAPITDTDNVRGPADAPVTLIEYSDFQCPACAQYYPIVERLLAEASTTIRFVYRHYPLAQHKNAPLAAMAAEAAGRQGMFWDMYSLLFVNQRVWENQAPVAARKIFEGYAERIGLVSTTKFTEDLDAADLKGKVDAQLAEGRQIGVNATPTFFINGKAIVNPANYDEFKALIDAAAAADSN